MSAPSVSLQYALLCNGTLNDYTVRQVQRRQVRMEQHLQSVIQKTRELQKTSLRTAQTTIPQLIECWKTLKEEQKKKNRECGHLFNPLALLPIAETTHSRLLGDLLNPQGSHGQERLLLHAFLQSIDIPDPSAGDWMLSIEEGKVDLCLFRRSPASVIIIENKSNLAIDQPNQLYRYWYENIHIPYPTLDYSSDEVKQAFQIIYLPPTAEKQPAFHSLQRPAYLASLGLPANLANVGVTVKTCSFRDHIANWLGNCEKIVPPENHRLRAHLQFYKELWI